MMRPIRVTGDDGKETTFACIHWRNFPTKFASVTEDPESLRARKVMSDTEYQRHQVWQRECGIVKMDESKCLQCPHVRRLEIVPHQVPKLVTLDGKEWTPAIDMASSGALAAFRRQNMPASARNEAIQARAAGHSPEPTKKG